MNRASEASGFFARHLSRVMTRGRDFLPPIDGLRFIAIMAVLAYHVDLVYPWHLSHDLNLSPGKDNPVSWMFEAGCKGVELFFVISGFILALPFARQHLSMGEPVRLKAYYLRRLTRLEPPYIIHLVFLFFAAWLVLRHQPGHPELYQRPDWFNATLQQLGVSLFYGHGLLHQDYPRLNLLLWSLEIEVQFYLLAPLLARVFLLRPAPARRMAIMALMLLPSAAAPLMTAAPWLGWSLLGKLQFFMAGFLFCDLYLGGQVQTGKRSWLWDIYFLAAAGLVVWLTHCQVDYPFLPWLALVMCIGAFRGRLVSWLLSRPLLTTIGGMCYTIYMYHWLMVSGLVRGTIKLTTHVFWLDLLIQFCVMAAIITVVCVILFVLFERPFMQRDWPRKFVGWLSRR